MACLLGIQNKIQAVWVASDIVISVKELLSEPTTSHVTTTPNGFRLSEIFKEHTPYQTLIV